MQLLNLVDDLVAATEDPREALDLLDVSRVEDHALLEEVLDIRGQVRCILFEGAASVDELENSAREASLLVASAHHRAVGVGAEGARDDLQGGRVVSAGRVIDLFDEATIGADALTQDRVAGDSHEASQSLLEFEVLHRVLAGLGVSDDPVQEPLLSVDHDDVGPLAVEQCGHVLLEFLDELVRARSRHDGVDRFERQVLVSYVLVLGDVEHVVIQNVGEELFEVRLEAWSEVHIEVLVGGPFMCLIDSVLRETVHQEHQVAATLLTNTLPYRYEHEVD